MASMETINSDTNTRLRAWVALPQGKPPWPSVIVIHDIFGMSDDLKKQCDWLADAGYVATAPDLYSDGGKLSCIRRVFRDLQRREGPTFDDIETVRSWLLAREDTTERIGVIGYCMGGAFSLLLAPSDGFDASSVNYGQVPEDAEDLLAGACPVIGSFGARDRSLSGAADRLRQALEVNDVDNDVKEYPSVGHSFLNYHTGTPAILMRVMGPLMGGGHDERATRDAKQRIEAFFENHLKRSAPSV